MEGVMARYVLSTARFDRGEMNNSGRVFVVVHGGIVRNVDVPAWVDGTHTVVDFDEAEVDAAAVWGALDAVDREYVQRECANLYATFFAEVTKCGE